MACDPGHVSDLSHPSLLVLFGSQTGNAQDVAEHIGREAKRRRYVPRVLAMDAFTVQSLPLETAILFVASTTGQGEVPDNMKAFWAFLLRKSLPPTSLGKLCHAVFGLGDSGYQQYNSTAKKLNRRLTALGSRELLERGLGDDQHFAGYDAALDPWLQELWPALSRVWPQQCHDLIPGSDKDLPSCKYEVSPVPAPPGAANPGDQATRQAEELAAGFTFLQIESAAAGVHASQPEPHHAAYGPGRPFMATVLVNERITSSEHTQDTRHIELDLGGSGISYEPGDILSIMPRQSTAAVARFLARISLSADAWISMQPAQGAAVGQEPVSHQVRVGALVAGALDVHGASPRRFFFEMLSHYTSAPHEVERLQYFASAAGRDDLAQYNQREGRTVLEVLEDFPSAQVPLQWLLHTVQRLKPRQFSIASSLRAHPGQAHMTVAIVDYKTPHRRRKAGVCTAWLAQLPGRNTLHWPSAEPVSASGLDPPLGKAARSQQAAVHVVSVDSATSPGSGMKAAAPHTTGELPAERPSQQPAEALTSTSRMQTDRVPVWLDRGVLRMPPDLSIPLVLIGPGTGVAPFRAFLEERAFLKASGHHVAPCHLYFGSRGQQRDFYYRQQWEQYVQAGVLAGDKGLVTAFSQDAPSKTYVTHRIRENGRQLCKLLMQGACVYISGSAKRMPQDVISTLEDCLTTETDMTVTECQVYMKRLQAGRRCVIEAWS